MKRGSQGSHRVEMNQTSHYWLIQVLSFPRWCDGSLTCRLMQWVNKVLEHEKEVQIDASQLAGS